VHKALNEQAHLKLLNLSVSVFINSDESLLEFVFLVIVRRRKIFQDDLEEASCLWLVQLTTVVCIEIFPDLFDKLVDDTISFDLFSHPSCERLVLGEVRVIKEDFKVAWEALPFNRAFERQDLAIDDAHMFDRLSGCRFGLLTIVVELELGLRLLGFRLWHLDSNLTATHVLRVSSIGLNSSAGSRIREDTRDAECATVGWIRDPGNVDETIVHGCERVQDHSAVSVLAIVYGHQSRV